jgi:hypothetical protein
MTTPIDENTNENELIDRKIYFENNSEEPFTGRGRFLRKDDHYIYLMDDETNNEIKISFDEGTSLFIIDDIIVNSSPASHGGRRKSKKTKRKTRKSKKTKRKTRKSLRRK